MRVLITGVTGFIGYHLAHQLEAAGAEVFGLAVDRPDQAVGKIFETDICDPKALEDTVKRCSPDVVVHLAGLSSVGRSWDHPGDYLQVNFGGTLNVLHAAGERRVVVASSAEVYGMVPAEEQPISEDRPLHPISPYAMTKAGVDAIARERGAIVARAFNIVGVGQSPNFVVPSFAKQLAAIRTGEHPPVMKVGNLSPRRDFMHVADAAAAYRTLIEHGEGGRAYNLSSGEACSIGEVLDRLRKISGVDATVETDKARQRSVDIPELRGDCRRIRALGWEPKHGLDQALEDIWRATAH